MTDQHPTDHQLMPYLWSTATHTHTHTYTRSTDHQVMPKLQYLPEEADREAVRDWVLSVCMAMSVDMSLPKEAQAQGTIYAGLYASDLATCIVTGFPVAKRDEVHNNNSVANKRGELHRYDRRKPDLHFIPCSER